MNWKRVTVFVAALLLGTAVVAFPFGFLRSYFQHTSGSIPDSLLALQGVTVLGSIAAVLAVLGYVQRERTILHGGAVALGTLLISFPLNVVLLKQPTWAWFVGSNGVVLASGVGLGIGILARKLIAGRAPA